MSKKELIVLVILLVAITTRFLFIQFGQSAIPGFTAVGAMMILAATYMSGWKKWIVPLGIFWVSDLLVNNVVYAEFYDSFQVMGSYWVYAGYAGVGMIAYFIMRQPSAGKLVITSTLGAVLFFLVTNFGSWLNPMNPYTQDVSGLMASYQAGVPFFRNAILGDLLFGFILFGVYDVIASRVDTMSPAIFRKSIA